MKARIFLEQQPGYYEEWCIKIEIDCKSVNELEEIISKLKEVTEILEKEKK